MAQPETSLMSRLVSLCKRRGFVYPASEIYGGLNGFWDYGPLGTQLKNNLRDAWWRDMVECPPLGPDGNPLSIVGLDTSIIQHPQAWMASGHVAGFADLMVDCRESKGRYRADHILCLEVFYEKAGQRKSLGMLSVLSGEDAADILAKKAKKMVQKAGGGDVVPFDLATATPLTSLSPAEQSKVIGPDAENAGTLTEPRAFNLMFHTYSGVFQTEDSKVYLRPETAQGIFLQYKNVLDTSRVRPPFGIAQIGKSFRNEVTPRNFIFRSREFEQMEMEFFVPPEDGMMWHEFWVQERMRWWEAQGVSKANLYEHKIEASELSHYSKATSDLEYRYPFTAPGFGELEGVAYRTDYDLKQHQEHSRTNLEYIDQEANRRYVPHVIEPAAGLTRGVLVLLCESYQYDESRASPEWLKIKPSLAPIKVGIFPLVNKDGMPEIAEKLYKDLRKQHICQYDAKQSIGKRYARMDEAGTPFCVTVDGDTLKDQTVTIRNRDTAQQERVALSQVQTYLNEKLAG
ncbi:MAG: glycine--tRNA ligase [Alphaproteobacteria bacterium]|nr:glycine--tRNA ligase [Alphaproteobacteria bacterium]MBV8548612.1 glycine--tRNA ligase [Alphaproteobacteria bacterium]